MTEILLHHMARTTVPDRFRRMRAAKPASRAEGSDAGYDHDTLFYAAIRHGRGLTIIAPKPLNLTPLLSRSRYAIGDVTLARPRLRNYYRHSVLQFRDVPNGPKLQITLPDGGVLSARVEDTRRDFLHGLDCELILSKNDNLDWITQRLRYHVRTQGVTGLVFIDNGSTQYSMHQLTAALDTVGLQRAVVVSMPYRYGPINRPPQRGRELFLQTSAYNIARLLWLQTAAGVLCMDNDEVLLPDRITPFERARAAWTGFVAFHGQDLYPAPEHDPPFSFADHTLTRPAKKRAATKWCLDPNGPLGRMQWRGHNLEGNALLRFQTLRNPAYYHCLGVTTGWKAANRFRAGGLQSDEAAIAFWRDSFSPAQDDGQALGQAVCDPGQKTPLRDKSTNAEHRP